MSHLYPKDEHDDRVLRYVAIDGFRLMLWDTGRQRRNGPQWQLGYRLTGPDGTVIFEGEEYGCAPGDAIDSDAALRGILGFLTCKPGDTDAEYFKDYTEAQLAFANAHGEELSLWTSEDDDGNFLPFENLDGWEES